MSCFPFPWYHRRSRRNPLTRQSSHNKYDDIELLLETGYLKDSRPNKSAKRRFMCLIGDNIPPPRFEMPDDNAFDQGGKASVPRFVSSVKTPPTHGHKVLVVCIPSLLCANLPQSTPKITSARAEGCFRPSCRARAAQTPRVPLPALPPPREQAAPPQR